MALVGSVALVGLLAALPTASASATSTSVTVVPAVNVENLLDNTPLTALNTGQLADALSLLPGFGELSPATLQEALTKTIGTLAGKGDTLGNLLEPNAALPTLTADLDEVLGLLSPLLESLLGGNPTAKLTEALGGATGTDVLGSLLGSSAEPQKLIGEILGAVNPEQLESVLGSTLGGTPFTQSTVAELAGQLETTPQGLVEDLGQTLTELPETASALTAPLSNGIDLSVLDSAKGLIFGLLEHGGELTEGAGTGGNGGSGGGSSTPASTTVVLQESTPGAPAVTASSASVSIAGKLKILSHKVKGHVATIVVETPSAGKLALGGKGVRSLRHETAKAERVSLKAVLTKAGASSLRKHRHHLKVTLKVSFKQTGGPSSSATVPVAFN